MTGLGGPSMLQAMCAAIDVHRDFERSEARPASPRMLGKVAVAQALAGDFKSAAATMQALSKYDPQQLRDPDGKWTTGSGSGSRSRGNEVRSSSSSSDDRTLDDAASRIANLTTSMEIATTGLCAEATSPDDRDRHARALVAATGQLHRELQALPDVDQFSAASRRALAGAHSQLTRTREQLHQCGALGKVRIDPAADDEDYETARRKVADHLAHERARADLGKSSLTILERIKEPAMDDYLISKLEAEADRLLKAVNRAINDNDGDGDDGDALADTDSQGGAESYDAESGTWDTSDASLDDDDDSEGDIWNLHLTKDERYLDRGRGHRNMGPVRVNERFPPDPHQLGFVDVVGEGKRHKFDARVDLVAERDGVSRNVAMSRARQEFPESYADYQMWLAEQPTNAQHMRRTGVGKRAPTTYEDLVSAEMAKGCTHEVAAQRIANTYGAARQFPRALGKRSDPRLLTKRLDARIADIVSDSGLSRTEALRALRKSGEFYW